MDIPAKIYITCASAELKKQPGTLIAVSPHGFYEVHVQFGSNTHVMLLPGRGDVDALRGAGPHASPGLRARAVAFPGDLRGPPDRSSALLVLRAAFARLGDALELLRSRRP